MVIKVTSKQFRNIWRQALNTEDNYNKRDAWVIAQTIQCLAGKECNRKIHNIINQNNQ